MADNNSSMKLSLPKDILIELNKRFELLQKYLEENDLIDLTFDDYENIFTNSGWFLPFDLTLSSVLDLTKLFKSNKNSEADKILINHYKTNLKEIRRKLITKHPERENILKEAFYCHKKKLYFASTILFIS